MLQLPLMGILVILRESKSIGDKVSPRLLHFTLRGGGENFQSIQYLSKACCHTAVEENS